MLMLLLLFLMMIMMKCYYWYNSNYFNYQYHYTFYACKVERNWSLFRYREFALFYYITTLFLCISVYLVFRPMCHFVFLFLCVSCLPSFGEIKIYITTTTTTTTTTITTTTTATTTTITTTNLPHWVCMLVGLSVQTCHTGSVCLSVLVYKPATLGLYACRS